METLRERLNMLLSLSIDYVSTNYAGRTIGQLQVDGSLYAAEQALGEDRSNICKVVECANLISLAMAFDGNAANDVISDWWEELHIPLFRDDELNQLADFAKN